MQSQSTAAILTTFNEVNMKPVIDLRNVYKDKFEKTHGVKLGFMSFFVKAAVRTLKKYPVVNASVDGNDIVYHGYYDIGIAGGFAARPRRADPARLDQNEHRRHRKADRRFRQARRRGKLGIEELTGGTFTISNGGTFGSMLSADHQPAAERHSRRPRDERSRRRGKRPDRDPPDELPRHELRPSHH